jgi:predicted transcriptional regulator
MDNAPSPGGTAQTPCAETAAEKRRRLAWEAERLTEAYADIAAGRLVDSEDVDAWIDSVGTEHELPVPYSGR